MRVVILADSSFARREQALLSLLQIGLADEGVRVVHAIPASAEDIPAPLYSTLVRYEDLGFAFSRPARVRRLVRALAGALEGDDEPAAWLDVVHAFGARAWLIALELGRQTGAPVALDVSSAVDVHGAGRLLAHQAAPTPTLLAPDEAVRRALSRAVVSAHIALTPWAVPTPVGPRPAYIPGRALALSILASGDDPGAVLPVLDALARVTQRRPDTLIFLSAEAVQRADAWASGWSVGWAGSGGSGAVWRRAGRLQLADRLSLVADMEGRRDPILQTDILIQPEALGRHHSLTLAAMAAGVVIVAATDPLVEYLIDGRTARLVSARTADAWEAALVPFISDPGAAQALATSARQYVLDERSASAYVASVLSAYQSMAASLPSRADAGSPSI